GEVANPSAASSRLRATSSTFVGTTRNGTPAASSNLRREGLPDASNRSTGAASGMVGLSPLKGADMVVPVVEKANDGGSRLLHRATCYVDHRPAMASTQPARVLDLVGNLPAIDVVGKVPVTDKVHAVAAYFSDALGAGN